MYLTSCTILSDFCSARKTVFYLDRVNIEIVDSFTDIVLVLTIEQF